MMSKPEKIMAMKLTPESVGLERRQYEAAIGYLFDRSEPSVAGAEWYWNIDEPEFDATPLEWTRIQTLLFANAGEDLAPFSDEQVGMGLNYLMNNAVSDVPHAAIHASVPMDEALRMMRAMPSLWRDCIGPRLADVWVPIGSSHGMLAFVCYMWFDVWPTFRLARELQPWKDAQWQVFAEMLHIPCREVQIAALHGIGHNAGYLDRRSVVDAAVNEFIGGIAAADEELKSYALAARQGMVQ